MKLYQENFVQYWFDIILHVMFIARPTEVQEDLVGV